MKNREKGLLVEIIKGKFHSSNNGLSNYVDEVVIIDESVPEIFDADPVRCPAVKLVRRIIGGTEYIHAEPMEKPSGLGWMASGAFLESSDSRFPNDYPIPLHDRQEFNDQGGN